MTGAFLDSVGQLTLEAAGLQEHFSWGQVFDVATAAASATGPAQATEKLLAETLVQAGVANVEHQLVQIAIGNQKGFDVRSTFEAVATAGIAHELHYAEQGTVLADLPQEAQQAVNGFAAEIALGHHPSLEALAAQVIGNEIGKYIGNQVNANIVKSASQTKQSHLTKHHDRIEQQADYGASMHHAHYADAHSGRSNTMTMEQYNAHMNRGSANHAWQDSYEDIAFANDFLDDLIDFNDPTPYVRDHGAYQYRKAALNHQSTNHVAANMPAPVARANGEPFVQRYTRMYADALSTTMQSTVKATEVPRAVREIYARHHIDPKSQLGQQVARLHDAYRAAKS